MLPEVRSKLLKLEATALFTQVKEALSQDRWWYFREAPLAGLTYRTEQSISPYRAYFLITYTFCGIPVDLYLEREAHVGNPADDLWRLSLNVEGKANETAVLDLVMPLREQGFFVTNGNENLDRQMNFSLGLYGACLMHVDVHFPVHEPPFPAFLTAMDYLESLNRQQSPSFAVLKANQQQADDDYGFDDDVIFGDWQTWK